MLVKMGGSRQGCLSVAVIGAGAAGLCAARHLIGQDGVKARVFEMSDKVGGTWVYNPTVGKDTRGEPIFSSMYKNLRTNLPKEVMAFPDFPFPKQPVSFLSHQQVLAYLDDYAAHYDLLSHIQFNTKVEKVEPVTNLGNGTKWEVTTRSWDTGLHTKEMYDSVIVCNGHFSQPNKPDIPGLDRFGGTVLHSHDYREAQSFSGRTVVLLGANASGQDIALEIAAFAKKVYLSHNKDKLITPLPDNVEQISGVTSCSGPSELALSDGSTVQCDDFIYATGYEYTLPFLTDDCKVEIVNGHVRWLYKHLINIHHPTMCIVGLPFIVCPFPFFDVQVRFFVKALCGEMELPSKEEMLKDTEAEMKRRFEEWKMPQRYFHKMGDLQWVYHRELSQTAGLQPLAPVVEHLYKHVSERRKTCLTEYKNDVFERESDTKYVEIRR